MAGTALLDADRAKKFKIFRNGDQRYFGKEFVLNKRRIRTWDAFLQAATNDVKSTEAVRSIRTPTNGTRIQSLDDLQDSYSYVAVGNGKFKKLGYLNIETTPTTHGKQSMSPRNADVKPVEHSRIQASGRIRKVPVDVVTVFVYGNGKDLEPARRVTLTHQMLRSWDAILAQVTEKVSLTSAARKLCTLEGQLVTDLNSIKTGAYYVAVGAEVGGFKKLEYGAQRPAFNSSPKRDRRRLEPINYIAPKQRKSKKAGGSENGTGLNSSVNSTGSSQNSSQKSSPTSNKPQRRERAKPIPNRKPPPKKEEDDVFHAKPIQHKRSGEKRKELDLDKDEGGVFKAKGGNDETQNAEEVEETKDTAVDLPIDQVEAEEVKDEDIEEGDNKKAKKETPRRDSKPPTPKRESKPPTPAPRQMSNVSGAKSERAERKQSSTPKPAEEADQSGEDDSQRKEQEDAAATKIQATYRGHQAHQAYKTQKQEKSKDLAATKIQSSYRGHTTRKNIQKRKEDEAATKIQASYRGHCTRKELDAKVKREYEAATKIQSGFRGYQGRREVDRLREEKEAQGEQEDKKDNIDGEAEAAVKSQVASPVNTPDLNENKESDNQNKESDDNQNRESDESQNKESDDTNTREAEDINEDTKNKDQTSEDKKEEREEEEKKNEGKEDVEEPEKEADNKSDK